YAVLRGANDVHRTRTDDPIQYLAYNVRKLPRPAQLRVVAHIRKTSELHRGPPVLPVPSHSSLDSIPLIGFSLVDAIKAGLVAVRRGVSELTERGARFSDGVEEEFDTVILATGFRAAIDSL